MRQLNDIYKELESIETVVDLTSAFEGIASMQIAKIKDQVQSSEKFFSELWQIYSQIRVDELFHFGRSQSISNVIEKDLMILITGEGSFSGDIDQRLIDLALKNYSPQKNDIIIIGRHGAVRLAQMGIEFIKSYNLPQEDRNINVSPIVADVQKHASTTIYYQSYISLLNQEVKQIQLSSAVAQRGKNVAKTDDVITEQNYIFEPSTYEVIDHLERSMMQITISEVILESKLAQYASRFKAMTVAHDRADESQSSLKLVFYRAQRHIKDERLREVINGVNRAAI